MNAMKKTMSLLLAVWVLAPAAQAQETASLARCISYGLAHSPLVQKSKLEIDRNHEKINEGVAAYLPQVKASATLMNNLRLATSILPGEIIGQPGTQVAVQFGTKYNVTGGIDASQVIYDQSIITGIRASKASQNLAQLNSQKTQEDLIYDIASAYYNAQITAIQKKIIESNLEKISGLVSITRVQFDNGFAKKTDLDRLLVNETNIKTDLQNLDINYRQQLVVLKYYMGAPLDSALVPETDVRAQIPAGTGLAGQTGNNIDLRILQSQKTLYGLSLQQINAGYAPSLSMSFRYAYQAQQNSLDIFNQNANWFPNAYLSFNLNVPIFDGLSKRARAQQVKIQLNQTDLDRQYLEQSISMQNIIAQNTMQINRSAVRTQEENVKLAEEVYATTQTQYKGGIIPLSDLLNAETALREAQTNYLKALIQVKLAELDLLKTTGNLQSVVNQ